MKIKNIYERYHNVIIDNDMIDYIINLSEKYIFDRNRQHRGDYFKKPTGYWYFNCVPTHGGSYQEPKEEKAVFCCRGSNKAGICSEERSLISPDYARNFICDFILGRPQPEICPTLFDAM